MYEFLRGEIRHVETPVLVLDVNGIGYRLTVSATTANELPPEGQTAEVVTELHVRQDAMSLYGFATSREREWFRRLTSVQGVGAKNALAILSALPPDELITALTAHDANRIATAKDVGKKTANRIITDLQNAIPAEEVPQHTGVAPAGNASVEAAHDDVGKRAVNGLVQLQVDRNEARRLVRQVREKKPDAGVDEIIRAALEEPTAAA